MNIETIVLISGGIDSTILSLRSAQNNKSTGNKTLLLHISYDHPAKDAERIASFNIYKKINDSYKDTVEYQCIDVPINAKDMFIGEDKEGSRVVPNRNAIMLSMAINVAVCNGAKVIQYGAVLDDLNDYVDCRKEFLDKMNSIAEDWNVKIEAPLMSINKDSILNDLIDVDIIKWCSSCYEPKLINNCWVSCGNCNSCVSNDIKRGDQIILSSGVHNEK